MEDCEPTFNTEPSSSAMRARPLTWVLTRSCQSTTDLAEAVKVFEPRAMLTAGITRATSPARELEDCGAASTSPGTAIQNEISSAKTNADGELVFILGTLLAQRLPTVVTGEQQKCQLKRDWCCAGITVVLWEGRFGVAI